MKIVHIVAGLDWNNGMANTAREFAAEEVARGDEAVVTNDLAAISRETDEVCIHGAWLPLLWKAAKRAKAAGAKLAIRPAGSYDPVRLTYHGWKKKLVAPFEHRMLRRADVLLATCEAEVDWIRAYEPKAKAVEITDLKRFFDLNRVGGGEVKVKVKVKVEGEEVNHVERVERVDGEGVGSRVERVERVDGEGVGSHVERVERVDGEGVGSHVERVERVEGKPLHLLYLGRRHPLKGVEYLEEAVRRISSVPRSLFPVPPQLKVVSNAFGEEKEKVWEWCDVLVLPTLSENFGRVVAEALERGKRVITTDGAPAWEGDGREKVKVKGEGEEEKVKGVGEICTGYDGRLIYLKGYRDGTREERVELLKNAICGCCR